MAPIIVRAPIVAPPPRPGRATILPLPIQVPARLSAPGSATLAEVSGGVRTSIAFQYAPSGWLAGQAQPVTPPVAPQLILSNGSGANQVRFLHAYTYLLSGAPVVVNLQALLDVDNLPFSFSVIRYFYLQNLSDVDGTTLYVGGGVQPWDGPWTAGSIVKVGPSTSGLGSGANNSGVFEKWEPSATGMPVTSLANFLKLDPAGRTFGVAVLLAGA
jgi:hypothetical protein